MFFFVAKISDFRPENEVLCVTFMMPVRFRKPSQTASVKETGLAVSDDDRENQTDLVVTTSWPSRFALTVARDDARKSPRTGKISTCLIITVFSILFTDTVAAYVAAGYPEVYYCNVFSRSITEHKTKTSELVVLMNTSKSGDHFVLYRLSTNMSLGWSSH